MWGAVIWGGISGSAVLIGALAAIWFNIPKKVIGYIMAFGTGVLLGAASYELLGESAKHGGLMSTAIGFMAGAILFTAFNIYISRIGGERRKRSSHSIGNRQDNKGTGLAIFVGTVIDAIPESILIGASLIESTTVSWLLVVAVFLSNIPEGLSSTAGLRKSGYKHGKIVLLWVSVLVISILCSLGGFIFMEHVSEGGKALIASFAGGGIIAMVTSTMMPEAYEDGGPIIGLISALGLLCSLILDYM